MSTFMKNTAVAALLLSACVQASLVQASELSVSGTIQPGSCTLSLPDGGALDFGELAPQPTTEGKWAFVEHRNAQLSIDCTARTHVGLKFRDLLLIDNPIPKDGFILATENDDHLAMVELRIPHGVADGKQVDFAMLHSSGSGSHVVRVDDPGNYMRIGDPRDPGFAKVSANMRVTMLGVDLEGDELENAKGLRSMIGIDLHYL